MQIEAFFADLTFTEFLGHASFTLLAASFLVRDIMHLRMFAIISNIAGVLYNYWLTPQNWLVIFWLTVFLLINLVMIALLFRERKSVSLNDEEQELFETVFKAFSPVEFMKLMRVGEWRNSDPDIVLAHEGEILDDIKLIYNGEAVVEGNPDDNGTAEKAVSPPLAHLKDGAFVGEMSFISGGAASATVRTTAPTRYISWPRTQLRALLARNPSMRSAMNTVFSADLTAKLMPKQG